ncbi:MAG: Na+/H+ antiporter NhaC family protein [Myxococcota bacterium]
MLLVVGLLLAAALLVPDADRERLVGQGVARRLAADLEAFEAGAGERTSLFAAVEALVGATPPADAAAGLRIDGERRRSAAVERALATPWNRLREARSDRVPPLRFGEGPAELTLALEVETAGDRVDVSGSVARGGARRSVASAASWPLPGRRALLPPLLALLVGLSLGRTLLALFVGVAAGAIVLAAPEAGVWAPLAGLWNVFAVYLYAELVDTFRLEILGFIACLVALVGVVSRAGGLQGMVDRVLSVARTARSSLMLTAGMGFAIFFDDYANCVLVGNTMRPVTDRLRVSREKLAYVVDSTAAPLAAISLLSTWIAFQVSVYSAQLPAVGIGESGYAVFLKTLPYRFYCLLTLFFVLAVILSRRDFGPMARAERRARSTGRLVREGGRPPISDEASRIEPAPHMPHDWKLAAAPLVVTCAVVLGSIFVDGGGPAAWSRDPAALLTLEGLTRVLLDGSGAGPLLDGALAGLGLALFLAGSNPARLGLLAGTFAVFALHGPLAAFLGSGPGAPVAGLAALALLLGGALGVGAGAAAVARPTSRPHLDFGDMARSGFASARTLAFAGVLLLLAWMIGAVCRDLATADYLVALSSEALPPALLPVLLFAVAALVAFSTGSSWSTMSILLPNVVALAATVGEASALGAASMVALCISAVLEGAVFGDHCSPISDTTVLSSVAAGSDHLDHVRTQAPYAAATAGAAVVFGYGPLLWVPGWGPGLAFAGGVAALLALLYGLGRPIPEAGAEGAAPPLAPT